MTKLEKIIPRVVNLGMTVGKIMTIRRTPVQVPTEALEVYTRKRVYLSCKTFFFKNNRFGTDKKCKMDIDQNPGPGTYDIKPDFAKVQDYQMT
jgi:hypothetical protein